MDWKKLGKQIIDNGAQILGDVLPYPGTSAAADALSEAFGVEKDPDAISQAIANDPNAAAKIRKVELNHKAQLKEIAAEHKEEMRGYEAQDTQGARNLSIKEMQNEDPYVRRTRPKMVRMTVWLAVGFVAAIVIFCVALIAFSDSLTPPEVSLLVSMMKYVGGFVMAMVIIMFRSYTTRRSMDKAMQMTGTMPSSLGDKLLGMVGGKPKQES